MERNIYDRYGLRSNPFRDLSSESLENVDIFHVVQNLDEELSRIKEEITYKENHAVVGILGGLGAGKTERLLLAANEAQQQNLYYVMRNMTFETKWIVEGITDLLIKQSKIGTFKRIFSPPKWYKNLVKLRKKAIQSYDPEEAGRIIAESLNENAPSFLLMNDFHHLSRAQDAERFLHVLHVLIDHIDHGVMIMISCDRNYFVQLMNHHPSLNQRITRKFVVPPLSDNEANLMIAKRLLEKRLADDIEPLFPFTPDGISTLNEEAKGNPRALLRISDIVVEYAARKRAIMIDEPIAQEVITLGKNKQLNIRFEDKEPVLKPLQPRQEIPYQQEIPKNKKGKLSIKNKLKKSSKKPSPARNTYYQSNAPLPNYNPNPGKNFSNPQQWNTSQNQEEIEDWEPINVQNENIYENYNPGNTNNYSNNEDEIGEWEPIKDPDENKESQTKQQDQDEEELHKQNEKPKDKVVKKQENKIEKQRKIKTKSKTVNKEPQSEILLKPKNPEPEQEPKSGNLLRIKCPVCNKVFAMELEEDADTIRCPYCEFIGSVS